MIPRKEWKAAVRRAKDARWCPGEILECREDAADFLEKIGASFEMVDGIRVFDATDGELWRAARYTGELDRERKQKEENTNG